MFRRSGRWFAVKNMRQSTTPAPVPIPTERDRLWRLPRTRTHPDPTSSGRLPNSKPGTRRRIRVRSGACSRITCRRHPLSTSDGDVPLSDFDRWLAAEFALTGAFTALAVLVEIAENNVTPLCSTYFNVIGDEIDWSEITVLFAGAGRRSEERRVGKE